MVGSGKAFQLNAKLLPTFQQCMLHSEQVWQCPGVSFMVRSKLNKFEHVLGLGLGRGPFMVRERRSLCGEGREIRAGGVPASWEQRGQGNTRRSLHDLWLTNGILGNSDMGPPVNRQTDRHTWVKTLPSCNFVDGW